MRNHALSLALMPIIIPQGLWVRYSASRMNEAAGPRQGQTGQGAPLRLLILGDSSAASVGVETQAEGLAGQIVMQLRDRFTVDWHLVARLGATTQSCIAMLEALEGAQFDVVVTALGVNDAKNGVSYGAWKTRLGLLYDRLINTHGAGLICASGMPPVRDFPLLPNPLRWALTQRAAIFDAAHRDIMGHYPQVRYLQGPPHLRPQDMAIDGFHPGPAVYARWGELAADLICENWPVTPTEAQC